MVTSISCWQKLYSKVLEKLRMNGSKVLSLLVFVAIFKEALFLSLKRNSPSGDHGIAKLTTDITIKYFSHLNCVVLVGEKCTGKNSYLFDFNLPSLTANFILLLSKETENPCHTRLIHNFLETIFKHGCTGYIVQLSSPQCFLKAWNQTAKVSLHRHTPQVLFLPTPDHHIISPEVAFSVENEIIFDLIIIDLYHSENSDSKGILKIVDLDHDKRIRILSECDASECVMELPPFYEDKTRDLKGKALKVATFNYPPYAIIKPLDGTEVRIVVEYARQRNCSIQVVTDEAEWGQIHENGTGNGILGNVALEKADVGLGALYLWYHEYKFLDYSVPYIRTGITCLAPRPELLSQLLLPVRPFTIFTWLIVLCAVVVASVALYNIKKFQVTFLKDCRKKRKEKDYKWFTTKEDTILRTLGYLVLQASSNRTVERGPVRHLVNWLHVAFLLVATSYSSGLASILTVPSYLPPIDTVPDLVTSDLQWGATHDAWIFSLREATETQMRTLVSRFRALTKEELYSNSLTANFAFSVERLPAGHFAVGDYITEESMKHLRLMKQDIYYEHCIFVFQKGSPYLKGFNHLIHRLLDSGLLLFWEGEVARRFLNSRVQSAVRESVSVGMQHHAHVAPMPIHLSHLEGAFIILSVGLLMAFIAFLAELYVAMRDNVYSKRRQAAARPSSKEPQCYGFHN